MRTLLLIALLAGCGAASGKQQQEALLESSTAYQEGVRWGRFEDAALFLAPAQRDEFLDERDQLGEDLRIDDYEVIRVHMKSGQKAARVRVKYTWHRDSVGTVYETVTEQTWSRSGGRWQLDTEYLKRGEPLPGVLEAPADDPGALQDAGDETSEDGDTKAPDAVGR